MTRDEVIALAREVWGQTAILPTADLERFAALIYDHLTWSDIHSCHPGCTKPPCVAMRNAVLAERDACAKVCDERFGIERIAQECAAAIRSRT